MNCKDTHHRGPRAAIPCILASAFALGISGASMAQKPDRDGRPFDRTYIATTATSELLEASVTPEGSTGEPVELLRTTFRLRPQHADDLLIQVHGECAALLDAVEDPPEEPAVSGASVRVWVEVDGEQVPISPAQPESSDGSVPFCGQGGSIDFATADSEQLAAAFDGALGTSGFDWSVQGVGKGNHEVVVMAAVDLQVEGDPAGAIEEEEPDAMALIGKRQLSVELVSATFEADLTPQAQPQQ